MYRKTDQHRTTKVHFYSGTGSPTEVIGIDSLEQRILGIVVRSSLNTKLQLSNCAKALNNTN